MNTRDMKQLPCFRCGVCCRKYQVRLAPGEIAVIARVLKITEAEFIKKYTDPRWPDENSYLIAHQDGACAFLKTESNGKTTSCIIHSHRPQDCRDWTPGLSRPECRRGLADWGLSIDSEKTITGSSDKIRVFYEYLDSLEPD